MLAAAVTIFAIVAVLGSVLWLKPSAEQQRQTRLRLLARQLGLDVRLSALPQTRRARVREERVEQGVIYRLLQFGRRSVITHNQVWIREIDRSQGTEWETDANADLPPALRVVVEQVLPQLPPSVVALELTPQGPGVYWRERGDEQTVRGLQELLQRLADALIAA